MKIAVIDMGTNTFHLLIAQVNGDSFEVIHKERAVVRVGKSGLKDGWIDLDAQKRALSTLSSFKKKIDELGIDKIYATATSAIRNAANGLDLVEMIKDTTDIDVKIISGQEEANYIFYGVKRALELGEGASLIMDIGGGSIEFIIAKDGEALWMESFEIGGQRLIDDFHKNDPITSEEIDNLHNYFERSLEKLHEACRVFKPTTLIGSSGTFDTLSDIHRIALGRESDPTSVDLPITMDSYHSIHEQLMAKDESARLEIPGMIPMRVNMIVVASVLISYILEKYNLTDLRASGYALKEGVLLSILDNVKDVKSKVK